MNKEITSQLSIRRATADDTSLILNLVKELARFVKSEDKVKATEEHIRSSLFEPHSIVHALICEKDGLPVGFAVYFFNFSTWEGKRGLYLEDFYITPSARRCGAGNSLFRTLAQLAVEQDCTRLDWGVLNWNKPAIQFYESCGANAEEDRLSYRLAGEKLIDFARS
jgi:GNAT superfamily N-acetyltransferase